MVRTRESVQKLLGSDIVPSTPSGRGKDEPGVVKGAGHSPAYYERKAKERKEIEKLKKKLSKTSKPKKGRKEKSEVVRCKCITQAGKQCSRNGKYKGYCYQHSTSRGGSCKKSI